MKDTTYMPPDEWIRDWAKILINRDMSKGEACRLIVENAASWAFNKGVKAGQITGAAQELEKCCAQISQCHMIPEEQRQQIASYLHETRTKASDR